ncbi:MAG: SPOR domain-containing protein [Acidobacteria bacterium]|nr:SPOR domain-containing protein [Acidobacteriota bacterium]
MKGQIDAAPTGAKSRIACVRCATTFDAVFTDGQMQVLLPQASPVAVFVESAANNNLTVESELAATLETLRETRLNDSLQLETSPALEDNCSTASPDLMSREAEETSPAVAQKNSQVFVGPDLEMQSQEMPGGSQSSIALAASLKANDAGKLSRPPSDVYGLGVRLMRVSPVWLLLAGLSFISLIVLCNWLIKPVEHTGGAASQIAAANNHAANQSINRVTVSNSTAQSPVNNQSVQPMTESGVAFIATEAKESVAPQATPDIEINVEKSVVGEKRAMSASSMNSSGEAKEGKVTVQIGSYNEAAQAEQRVVNLKSAGFEARSVAVEIPKRGTWYRVQSGRFINRDEAERYGKQLRDKGIVSSFITTDIQK